MPNLRERDARRDTGVDLDWTAGLRDVGIYGLRVRSAIDLGEWSPPPPGEPHVTVVEEPSETPTFDGPLYTARTTFTQGEFRLEVRGVARYSAAAGSRIRVAPEIGAKAEDVRHYLTGAMFGVILHQRGIHPLHASCVAIDDSGIAFAAPSGSGKSTLTAALLQRGATFVSDDICVLTPAESGEFLVFGGAGRLKLDEAATARLYDVSDSLQPAGGNRGKFHMPVSATYPRTSSTPLSRVYLLGFGEGPPRLERLEGLEAISALLDETYLLAYAGVMGLSPRIFRTVAGLCRTITVSRLIRPRGFEHLEAVLDLIEHDVRGVRQRA